MRAAFRFLSPWLVLVALTAFPTFAVEPAPESPSGCLACHQGIEPIEGLGYDWSQVVTEDGGIQFFGGQVAPIEKVLLANGTLGQRDVRPLDCEFLRPSVLSQKP